jgi:hypothetical protein
LHWFEASARLILPDVFSFTVFSFYGVTTLQAKATDKSLHTRKTTILKHQSSKNAGRRPSTKAVMYGALLISTVL